MKGKTEESLSLVGRREFIRWSGMLAASTFFRPLRTQDRRKSGHKPNVLFIVIDDLRPELGCYGNPIVKTPHIDALARRGALFSRAYCQQALCNPARVSLLTGLRPDTLRVWNLDRHFRQVLPMVRTLPQGFMRDGYNAAYVGKIFHGRLQDPDSWSQPEALLGEGYIYQDPETRQQIERLRYVADWLGKSPTWQSTVLRGPVDECYDGPDAGAWDTIATDSAIALMSEMKASGPFFLAVGYVKPHLPYSAPRRFWDLYDRERLPLPEYREIPQGSPPFAMSDNSELGYYEDFLDVLSPALGGLSDSQIRRLKHGYYACVSYVDGQVGRLLQAVEDLDLGENTIIILVGDQGIKLGEYGAWGKRSSYEVDVHCPLIISAPWTNKGLRIPAMVENVDIYPTICELAGIELPSGLEGTSCVPLLSDPHRPWKTAVFHQSLMGFTQRFMGHAMRTDRYRYVRWTDALSNRVLAHELYDHQTDPAETVNIAVRPETAPLLEELEARLRKGWKGALPL